MKLCIFGVLYLSIDKYYTITKLLKGGKTLEKNFGCIYRSRIMVFCFNEGDAFV